jgi:hypothetical protein
VGLVNRYTWTDIRDRIFGIIILKRLRELSLNISKFIITKEGNILPMAGKRLLTVNRNGTT